jgi:WD40 repeat protein
VRTGKHHRWLALQQEATFPGRACLTWSPDSNTLAVGGLDNSVRLWDVASGRVRREFRGDQASATCLAFSPDGRLLASGSQDTTLLIWKVFPDK